MKLILIYISLLFITGCVSKPTANSGYQNKDVIITKVCDLPAETIETSGIIFFQGLLWTFNDSDNDAIIYGIDTGTGALVREVYVNSATNIDWEAITQDELNIYIADNGNNSRARDEYKIYVISKDSLSGKSNQSVIPKKEITYLFADSDLNRINRNKVNVDSEAILVDGDSMYVYIKDWLYNDLSAFSMSLDKDFVISGLGGSYELGFAVTAATRVDNSRIAFLGYRDYRSYLSILESNPKLTGEIIEVAHFELLELQGYQTEGITYEDGKFYISCEEQVIEQALFRLEFK